MSSPGEAEVLETRRNGKLRSCEPCRKAKSACDHHLPHCHRCARRGITAECIYHPAPMTKPRADGETATERGPKRRRSAVQGSLSQASPGDPASPSFVWLQEAENGTENDETLDNFGPNSFGGAFVDVDQMDEHGRWTALSHDSLVGRPHRTATEGRIQLGAQILAMFPDRAVSEQLLDRHFSANRPKLHQPMARMFLSGFWDHNREIMASPRRPAALRALSERFIENSTNKAPDEESAHAWIYSQTGTECRIETVGLLLAIFASAVGSCPDWHPLVTAVVGGPQSPFRDKDHWWSTLYRCAGACAELCRSLNILTDIYIGLLYFLQILGSWKYGDHSQKNDESMGVLAAAITAAGLQLKTNRLESPLFFVQQLQDRMYVAAFDIDKQGSIIAGRPPYLSRRYNNRKMPLDLSDEEILLSGAELEHALASLDANGWNTTGAFYPASISRALMTYAVLRDEISETMLGADEFKSPLVRDDIKRRSHEAYNNMPIWVRNAEDQHPSQSSFQYINRIMIQNEFLMSQFLLDRLPPVHKQGLIETAMAILDNVVFVYTQRDRFADFVRALSWATVCFGVPSAGFLAIELLSATQNAAYYPYNLPRSTVMQNLSFFVKCLDSTTETASNHKLLAQMSKVIQRILDQALEPQLYVPPQNGMASSTVAPNFFDVDLTTIADPFDDLEFSEWLNSVDWNSAPLPENFN